MPGRLPRRDMPGIDPLFDRPATPHTIDFSVCRTVYLARDEKGLMRNVTRSGYRMDKPGTITTTSVEYHDPMGVQKGIGLSNNPGQKRARARRRLKKGIKMADDAWDDLYKPIEEWDLEELARGRPRNKDGRFHGPAPKYITNEVHERAMERFKLMVKQGLNTHTVDALGVIGMILKSAEEDNRGKPLVPYSTRLDAAKYLIDHTVGKATQPTSTDISVKLQGILGQVMVTPDQIDPNYHIAHTGSRGEIESGQVIDVDIVEDDD